MRRPPFATKNSKIIVGMSIPREFIKELIDRADLADIVGGRVKLKKRGENWFGLCPFHGEKTPSFSVNPAKGFYHCFGCGAHGNAVSFLTHFNGGDFIAGVEALAAHLGVTVPRSGNWEAAAADDGLLRQALEHWRQQLKKSPTTIAYLQQRGISGEIAARYELGYATADWQGLINALAAADKERLLDVGLVRKKDDRYYDYFRDRIIFPITEAGGRLRGFGARVLRDEDQPKYLNSAETASFSKRRILYGLPQAMAAAREKQRLIICEGYMDVLMLAQAGFAEAVATMGTAATVEQMKKAARLATTLVFAFDADDAGQKAMLRGLEGVLPALKDGVGVSFLSLPDGDDPDSYIRQHGAAAFERLLSAARPLGDYMADALWKNAADDNAEARATGVMREGERLVRLLNARDAPYLRQLLTEKLAKRAAMAATTIKRAVEKSPSSGKQSTMRMLEQGLLYNLLCCLAINPTLAERLPAGMPLPGAAHEAEVVAVVLSSLQWHMDEETPDVLTLLEENGYHAVAKQVNASVHRCLTATDMEAQFDIFVRELQRAHSRLTGVDKQAWLDKMGEVREERKSGD